MLSIVSKLPFSKQLGAHLVYRLPSLVPRKRILNHPTMFHYKKVLCLSVLVLVIKQSSQSPLGSKAQEENVDVDVDISCIANATCINNVSNKVVRALKLKQVINFGAFVIEPVPNAKAVEGRSASKLWDLVATNSLHVPLGSYSLSLQKSEEYDNYLEVVVSKTVEGGRKKKRKSKNINLSDKLFATQVKLFEKS